MSEIVVGDLKGDDNLEILLSQAEGMHLFDHRGQLLNTMEHPSFAGGAGGYYFYVGAYTYDYDGDGTLEILKTSDKVYVYNSDFEVIDSSFPFFDPGEQFNKASYPYFTDLDADGDLDVITTSIGGPTGRINIFAWDLAWPYQPTEDAWLTNGYDAGNTSCYRCVPSCPADFDGNGDVGFADLTQLLSVWGACATSCPEDLDGDGQVAFTDLTTLLGLWGPCP